MRTARTSVPVNQRRNIRPVVDDQPNIVRQKAMAIFGSSGA
jgi:hypothetical protein